jgi:hypothetical protein
MQLEIYDTIMISVVVSRDIPRCQTFYWLRVCYLRPNRRINSARAGRVRGSRVRGATNEKGNCWQQEDNAHEV